MTLSFDDRAARQRCRLRGGAAGDHWRKPPFRAAALTCILVWVAGCTPSGSSPAFPEASGVPWFTDITEAAGLVFVHDHEPQESYFMPEIMGSGGGFLDYDGDGWLDIVLLNGSWSEGANSSRMRNRLYRQRAEGVFEDATRAAGWTDVTGYGVGLAAADVDNDGNIDLYVTGFGGDRLWLNNGDGTFSEGTDFLETVNHRWGTAAAFFDYDGDGWLDLYVVNYLDYYPGTQCDEGTGRIDYCGPKSFSGTVGKLYRNLGGVDDRGRMFTDATLDSGIAAHPGPGLGLICRDFNGDLKPDVYVANDMSPDLLWIQQPDGTFREEGVERGIAYNRLGQAEASMGIISGDLDGDGIFDLFLTNLRGETNTLFLGTREGFFTDATAGSGLGPASLAYTGFGVVALDIEFDGDLDLIVVNGRVKRGPPLGDSLGAFWSDYAQPHQIYLNDGHGRFADASSNGGELTARLDVARAIVSGDLDNDGDLDLLVTSCAGRARLFRNDTPRTGNWLMVRACDHGTNRDAIGTKLFVKTARGTVCREVDRSSGYLSSHDPRVLFGLGDCDGFDEILAIWPDGSTEEFAGGPANRELVLVRGRGRARAAGEGL